MPQTLLRNTDSIRTLRLLVEVCRTGQLTTAAEKFGQSLSAASRQLNHLREDFDDPLFIRNGKGLMPTPRLRQIVSELVPILDKLDQLGHDAVFDPKMAVGEFRIATFDNGLSAYLFPILGRIRREAPHVQLEVCFVPGRHAMAEALRDGTLQLIIHPLPPKRADIAVMPLTPMDYVLLVRKNHPLVAVEKTKGQVTRKDLQGFEQVMPGTKTASRPWVTLQEEGQPSVVLPYFNASPFVALQSDAFVWMPKPTADHWLQFDEFRAIEPPEDCRCTFTPSLFWHRRSSLDPLHQWIRSQILNAARHPE